MRFEYVKLVYFDNRDESAYPRTPTDVPLPQSLVSFSLPLSLVFFFAFIIVDFNLNVCARNMCVCFFFVKLGSNQNSWLFRETEPKKTTTPATTRTQETENRNANIKWKHIKNDHVLNWNWFFYIVLTGAYIFHTVSNVCRMCGKSKHNIDFIVILGYLWLAWNANIRRKRNQNSQTPFKSVGIFLFLFENTKPINLQNKHSMMLIWSIAKLIKLTTRNNTKPHVCTRDMRLYDTVRKKTKRQNE